MLLQLRVYSIVFSSSLTAVLSIYADALETGSRYGPIFRLGVASGAQVALVDPKLCTSLSQAQTTAMALTALSACVDALLARELALGAGTPPPNGDVLLKLGSRGIGAVAEGLPVALADGSNILARELLTMGSVCAGQLSAITPAPPTQV